MRHKIGTIITTGETIESIESHIEMWKMRKEVVGEFQSHKEKTMRGEGASHPIHGMVIMSVTGEAGITITGQKNDGNEQKSAQLRFLCICVLVAIRRH